jgi:hypothetical protein
MSIPVAVPLRRMSAVAMAVALAVPLVTLRAAPLTLKAAFDLALPTSPLTWAVQGR